MVAPFVAFAVSMGLALARPRAAALVAVVVALADVEPRCLSFTRPIRWRSRSSGRTRHEPKRRATVQRAVRAGRQPACCWGPTACSSAPASCRARCACCSGWPCWASAPGALLNVLFGVRPRYYGIALASAIFGGMVAGRQVLLHVRRATRASARRCWACTSIPGRSSPLSCIGLILSLMLWLDAAIRGRPTVSGCRWDVLPVVVVALFLFVAAGQCRDHRIAVRSGALPGQSDGLSVVELSGGRADLPCPINESKNGSSPSL